MEIPSISIRRRPVYAFILLGIGLIVVAIGLLYSDFWVLFMGVLPVIIAALMMLSPFVVLSAEAVELRNIFGLVRASYAHDGLHLLTVQHDVLFIQRGDMRAPINRIAKARLHPGDWEVMLETLAHARQLRSKKGKSHGTT